MERIHDDKYREHRLRISKVKSKIDSKPPVSFSKKSLTRNNFDSSSSVTSSEENMAVNYVEKDNMDIKTTAKESFRNIELTNKKQDNQCIDLGSWYNQKYPNQKERLAQFRQSLLAAVNKGTINSNLINVVQGVANALKEGQFEYTRETQRGMENPPAVEDKQLPRRTTNNCMENNHQDSGEMHEIDPSSGDEKTLTNSSSNQSVDKPVRTFQPLSFKSTSKNTYHVDQNVPKPVKYPAAIPESSPSLNAQIVCYMDRNHNSKKERLAVKVLKYAACNKMDHSIPKEIFRYYERLTFYKQADVLQQLLRPKIYMKLGLKCKNYFRDLGTMTFQLYTEACSDLILELLRCCNTGHGHDHVDILRIFDPIWIEGELSVRGSANLRKRLMRNDPKIIRHESGPGILSFALRPGRTFYDGQVLCFAISLSPLEVPEGHRIAVGVLTSGFDLLKEMKRFATKSGKPTDKIVVTKLSFNDE